MTYKTQMHAARQGIITKEMEYVSKNEDIPMNVILEELAKGSTASPSN